MSTTDHGPETETDSIPDLQSELQTLVVVAVKKGRQDDAELIGDAIENIRNSKLITEKQNEAIVRTIKCGKE